VDSCDSRRAPTSAKPIPADQTRPSAWTTPAAALLAAGPSQASNSLPGPLPEREDYCWQPGRRYGLQFGAPAHGYRVNSMLDPQSRMPLASSPGTGLAGGAAMRLWAMLSRRLEWTVAGGLAGCAVARLTAADRHRVLERPAAPLLSFTPQAAAGAWLGALLLRGRGPSATAALAGAALTAAVAPRAVRRRQPGVGGPALRVLTVNLLVGRAAEDAVVGLVRKTGADVLFLQELTDDSVTRLKRAGLNDLLPNEMTDVRGDSARGSGIYARYPLGEGLVIAPTTVAQPTARLDLPSGRSVQLVCVHIHPPHPPWSRRMTVRWRREMSVLPPPGDDPVILAGDFNATFDHAQFRRLLRRGYADAASQFGKGLTPTWRIDPRRPALLTIDHVLFDPRCAVRATSVLPMPGSDHRAVYAEFRLPA
jgi:endonuclease/exonuclease/phosphatase family metal-dependent hydrolase